jgi:hypothetical protein
MKASEIPPHMVRLMEKSQREALGIKTPEEAIADAEIKTERDLHHQIEGLLRLKGIVFFASRTDKRTTRPLGEPDFLFSVIVTEVDKNAQATFSWPIACAWELKVGNNTLSLEQEKMLDAMQTAPNGWCCRIIRSVEEAVEELKRLGL